LIGIFALPNAFHFVVQEEAFCHSIVPTVALTVHSADEAMLYLQPAPFLQQATILIHHLQKLHF
jgi:hypothetical protein